MAELELDEFLRSDDIQGDTQVKFTDAGGKGVIHKGEGEEDVPTFEIGVMLPSGEKKLWTVNKTSQRTIASVFGKNTEAWIGKTVTLFTVSQNVRGSMKDVIYSRVPKQNAPPA